MAGLFALGVVAVIAILKSGKLANVPGIGKYLTL
jgi:hypothetical protein